MAIETRYYGIFHRSTTSAYDAKILSFYRLEYDTDGEKFLEPAKWDAIAARAKNLRNEQPNLFGDFVIKRTDHDGNPLDRPALKYSDDFAFVLDDEAIIKHIEDLAWPTPDDQMGENCPLAYGGYWIIDDGKESPHFLMKKDAEIYAMRNFRDIANVVEVKTTRPAVCPTMGVCPRWCYDVDYFKDYASDRWPKMNETRHIAVGAQWMEDYEQKD